MSTASVVIVSYHTGSVLEPALASVMRQHGLSNVVLIDNGNETEWLTTPMRMPELVAEDLLAAARQIAALPPGAIAPESVQTAERA